MLDYIKKNERQRYRNHKCKDEKKTSDITDNLALVGSQGFDKVDTIEVRTK